MRILLLGGTGAMGSHLVELLAKRGDEVAVTSRQKRTDRGNIRYIEGNACSKTFLNRTLEGDYDAVVDFMVRSTEGFAETAKKIMARTNQYVFVSSYRVYADSPLLSESSLRLLDVTDDRAYLASDEYALAKARCEDVLVGGDRKNWTIVRPGITFDGSGRFQLGTLEANTWLFRAQNDIPVLFPNEMLAKETTLSWGGDVARMIAGIIGRQEAMGEMYNVSTSEHLPWSEVAKVYQKRTGLTLVPCAVADYEDVVGGHYQIWYDRMLDRRIDNTKILSVCGMSADEIVPVRERLAAELWKYLSSGRTTMGNISPNARMDRKLGGMWSLRPLLASRPSARTLAGYTARRFL